MAAVFCSRISDWLGGLMGTRRFIQFGFLYSYLRGRVRVHGVMVSILDELGSWQMANGKNVMATGRGDDGGRNEIRDD